MAESGVPVLVLGVHDWCCALELREIVETLRPLSVQPVPGAPEYVLGLAVIRGQAQPVVDLALLLTGVADDRCTRFVCVRVGERQLALAVASVQGIRLLPAETLQTLPPLVADGRDRGLDSLGVLDRELLALLAAARLLPEAVWQQLEEQVASA